MIDKLYRVRQKAVAKEMAVFLLLPSIRFSLQEAPQKLFDRCEMFANRLENSFRRCEYFFVGAIFSAKQHRALAIDVVQKSSNPELSSRFLDRLKVKRHFWAS